MGVRLFPLGKFAGGWFAEIALGSSGGKNVGRIPAMNATVTK